MLLQKPCVGPGLCHVDTAYGHFRKVLFYFIFQSSLTHFGLTRKDLHIGLVYVFEVTSPRWRCEAVVRSLEVLRGASMRSWITGAALEVLEAGLSSCSFFASHGGLLCTASPLEL